MKYEPINNHLPYLQNPPQPPPRIEPNNEISITVDVQDTMCKDSGETARRVNAKQIPIIPISLLPAGLVEWTMFLPIPGGTMPVNVWIAQEDYNTLQCISTRQRINTISHANTTKE